MLWIGLDMLRIPDCLSKIFHHSEDEPKRPLPKLPTVPHATISQAWWESKAVDASVTLPLTPEEYQLTRKLGISIRSGKFSIAQLPETNRQCLLLALKSGDVRGDLCYQLQHGPQLLSRPVLDLLGLGGDIARAVHLDHLQAAVAGCDLNAVLKHIARDVVRDLIVEGTCRRNEEAEVLWEHAEAAAMAMEALCRGFSVRNDRLPYVLALLHDIGRSVVLWTVLASSQPRPGQAALRSVQEGLSPVAGRMALAYWGLPKAVQEVVEHARDETLDPSDRLVKLKALVQVADAIASRCGHGTGDTGASILSLPGARLLGLTAQNAPTILGSLPLRLMQAG